MHLLSYLENPDKVPPCSPWPFASLVAPFTPRGSQSDQGVHEARLRASHLHNHPPPTPEALEGTLTMCSHTHIFLVVYKVRYFGGNL